MNDFDEGDTPITDQTAEEGAEKGPEPHPRTQHLIWYAGTGRIEVRYGDQHWQMPDSTFMVTLFDPSSDITVRNRDHRAPSWEERYSILSKPSAQGMIVHAIVDLNDDGPFARSAIRTLSTQMLTDDTQQLELWKAPR